MKASFDSASPTSTRAPGFIRRTSTTLGLVLALPSVACSGTSTGSEADAITAGAGGMFGSGGQVASGGTTASGGTGGGTGGSSEGSGGSPSTGGGAGTGGTESCPFPDSFQWTSSGPLAEPKSPPGANWVSMKDFTITRKDSEYLVYATVWNELGEGKPGHGWQGTFLKFSNFDSMAAAPQTSKPGMVAPHLFYFTPKDTWVLSYQWGFQYATSKTPENPTSWSSSKSLLGNNPTIGGPAGTGPIDQTLICDESDCYIFFAGDNGVIYRGSMPVADFPGTFNNSAAILQQSKTELFEGVEVYKIKGEKKYLMIVEAAGTAAQPWGARFFRAFTSDSLSGTWTAMPQASSRATPFAGANNVTYPDGDWSDDISHGDIVRDDPSEKKEIDPCNLRFLYQGHEPGAGSNYGTLPYRPGLLTLVKK